MKAVDVSKRSDWKEILVERGGECVSVEAGGQACDSERAVKEDESFPYHFISCSGK